MQRPLISSLHFWTSIKIKHSTSNTEITHTIFCKNTTFVITLLFRKLWGPFHFDNREICDTSLLPHILSARKKGTMYKVRCKKGGGGFSLCNVVTLFNVRWGEGVKNCLQLVVVLLIHCPKVYYYNKPLLRRQTAPQTTSFVYPKSLRMAYSRSLFRREVKCSIWRLPNSMLTSQ